MLILTVLQLRKVKSFFFVRQPEAISIFHVLKIFSNLSWWLVRRLVHVKHSSIINIIEDRALVPECIQEDMNPKNILEKLLPLLDDKSEDRNNMISDFNKIKRTLGDPGVYKRIAEAITMR